MIARLALALQEATASESIWSKLLGIDRLKLDDKRIASMAKGLREVAALPDPVGRILDERLRPNGLKLQTKTIKVSALVPVTPHLGCAHFLFITTHLN